MKFHNHVCFYVRHVNKALECRKCKLTFSDKTIMKAHMVSLHALKKDFKCTKCHKTFGTIRTLQNHDLSVHEGKTSECDICGKILSNRHKLRTHKEFVHEKLKPHECSVCKMTFKTPFQFKKHRNNVIECCNAVDLFVPKITEKPGRRKGQKASYDLLHTSINFPE